MAKEHEDPRLSAARAAAAAGRWAEAADGFEAAARALSGRAQRAAAQEAWALAGDALRRDDRPARAARALKAALDLLPHGDGRRSLLSVSLAAVLAEAGEPIPAEILLRESVAGARELGPRLFALDQLIGTLNLLGRCSEAEGPLAELGALVEQLPPAAAGLGRATVAFRRAVQLRHQGELAAADPLLEQVIAAMGARKETLGAAAAAAGERAELALARGAPEEAERWLDDAARMWTAVGRRSGLYRCEAGLVRVALAAGQTPLASALAGPVQYAGERGMALMEAELRLARGLAWARGAVRGAETELDRAVSLAERAGAALLEGRARLLRRRAGFLYNDLERTRACLAEDAIWRAAAAAPQAGEARQPW